jgi:radical SAM enzyme (TIGR01210 family)
MAIQTSLSSLPADRSSEARADLKKTLELIRNRHPRGIVEPGKALASDIRTGYLRGRTVERLVITLRSSGCGWVRRGGGCTMCGHYPGTTQGTPVHPQDFVAQFKQEVAFHGGRLPPVLCLYNSGSVLNEGEVPQEALDGILAEVAEKDEIEKVVLESRPEYCSEEKIESIRKRIGSRTLEIAMGLESCDDRVLTMTLNKGFLVSDFRRMVESIRQYVRVRIYVLLKGPFLTEGEAVEDAVASIRFAETLSPSEIHLEPATLQEHTLLYSLYNAGMYRLPWLWSVYEVLRRVGTESRVYVSPFNHMPRPAFIPENCPECTESVRNLIIEHYNLTFDLDPLEQYRCSCRKEWEEALSEQDPRPLDERVLQGLQIVQDQYL